MLNIRWAHHYNLIFKAIIIASPQPLETFLFQDNKDLHEVGDIDAQEHLVGGQVEDDRPLLPPTLEDQFVSSRER